MKKIVIILILSIFFLGCAVEDKKNLDDSDLPDNQSEMSDKDSGDDSEPSDLSDNQSDLSDQSEVSDKDTGDTASDDDFSYDSETVVDEDYMVDIDPGEAGCDVPENVMEPFDKPSTVMFTFSGLINDSDSENPVEGTGNFSTKLRGENINIGSDSHIAYLGTAYKIYISTFGIVDEEKGIINYSEISLDFNDIMDAQSGGYNFLDMSEGELGTNFKLYSGLIDKNMNIRKLCLEAVPTGQENNGGYYLCNTDYTYMSLNDSDPDYLNMAGNIVLYDDAEYLRDANGMQCVCSNNAGGWRNCDPGVPDSYGLFRSKLEAAQDFSGYIFDETKLFPDGNFNQSHAETHPEGVWTLNDYSPAPFNGGLNIGAYSDEMGTGLYRFVFTIPPSGYKSTGITTKDSSKDLIIFRQQSFSQDLTTQARFWVNAYFPTTVKTGDKIDAGGGNDNVRIVVYDSQDYCVMAVGCKGYLTITEATGLDQAEGGELFFKSEEVDETAYSVGLFHPTEAPADCDIGNYFSSVGLDGVTYCDKE